MSSLEVRTAVNQAVADATTINTYDISDYVTLEDCLSSIDSEAVLVQYVASGDNLVTVGGQNNNGWEEDGSVVLHLMVPTGFASSPAVTKGEEIQKALRGKRLTNQITIQSCDPFTDFGGGSTGLYSGAWHGWASNLFYVNRSCG